MLNLLIYKFIVQALGWTSSMTEMGMGRIWIQSLKFGG